MTYGYSPANPASWVVATSSVSVGAARSRVRNGIVRFPTWVHDARSNTRIVRSSEWPTYSLVAAGFNARAMGELPTGRVRSTLAVAKETTRT